MRGPEGGSGGGARIADGGGAAAGGGIDRTSSSSIDIGGRELSAIGASLATGFAAVTSRSSISSDCIAPRGIGIGTGIRSGGALVTTSWLSSSSMCPGGSGGAGV